MIWPILALSSLVLALASLWLVTWIICRLPADYLHSRRRGPLAPMVARNLLGIVLVLFGLVMLATPGQGLLTLGVGLLLMDYPGKRRMLRWLLGRRSMRRIINRIRARRGLPPLQIRPPRRPS